MLLFFNLKYWSYNGADISTNIQYNVVSYLYLSSLFSGGMFHYKKDHPNLNYNVQSHCNLFVKDPDNLMFNQFGMYILSELPKVQNMKSFAVHEHTNIDEFVSEIKTLPDGSKIYRFSKELLAYVETLVAFSPYYRVNDQHMVFSSESDSRWG